MTVKLTKHIKISRYKMMHGHFLSKKQQLCGYKNDYPISLDDIWKMVADVGESLDAIDMLKEIRQPASGKVV